MEETNKSIAQVARDLGVNEGTLGNRVNQAREGRGEPRGTNWPSSSGSGLRSPRCGWSVMSSSVPWSCG
ncbi:MAG: hypothetical protein IPO80_10095 [Propionibacteriaceae bacterium]|nr:hypothetical protein [Propionibacteriaceae bacterium]